jgi:hypothetical protein
MTFEPNTTPTPNWLYNGEMKKMNETELKVVLLVTRKTLGWFDPMTGQRKEQDYISQSQFKEFTGQSHTAIAKAIQRAVDIGWIIARDRDGNLCNTSEKRRRRKVWYQLGGIFTNKISKQQCGLDEKDTKKSKQHSCTHLSNNVDNTKETITKENIYIAKQSFAVNDLLVLFEPINPSYKTLFANTTQRSAIERMVKEHGEEKITKIIKILKETNHMKYAPVITTPLQLESKLGQLLSFIGKQKNNNKVIEI